MIVGLGLVAVALVLEVAWVIAADSAWWHRRTCSMCRRAYESRFSPLR